jgi:hypothetical protein
MIQFRRLMCMRATMGGNPPKAFQTIVASYDGPYPRPNPDHLLTMASNLQACFDGILHTIWINSDKKYNVREIEFKHKTLCPSEDSHPTFVLDYEDRRRYGTGPSTSGQYFGVEFRRIRVRPVAYALRTDLNPDGTNHLRSWVFQGKNANEKNWTTLDERLKDGSLMKAGAFVIGFVETRKYFTEFRVMQTGPSHMNSLSFNLSGFEIHGHTTPIGDKRS